MSATPLYDLANSLEKSSLTPLASFLRDDGKKLEEIETRRKADLKAVLLGWRGGDHPFVAACGALEATLGVLHPMSDLVRLAHDPTSFDRVIKAETPEEFQQRRKEHIEELARKDLHPEYHSFPCPQSAQDTDLIEALLERLDRSETRSLDIAGAIANHVFRQTGKTSERRNDLNAVNTRLRKLKKEEDNDVLVHPNDARTQGDILDVLAGCKELSHAESSTRDSYRTPDEIETRRSAGIVTALERWRDGVHPLEVLHDLMTSCLENVWNPFKRIVCETNVARFRIDGAENGHTGSRRSEDGREWDLLRNLEDIKRLRRTARDIMRAMQPEAALYRCPEDNPGFAAQIGSFIEQVVEGEEPALSVALGLLDAMFDPEQDTPNILEITREYLRRTLSEENEARKARAPMGALHTRTEAEIRAHLRDFFAGKAAETEGIPATKLTAEILIEPTGSGMIKPYPSGEEERSWEEQVFGTTTARITTYSVTLVPNKPEFRNDLWGAVRKAVGRIADIPPAFDIPIDLDSQPYERPYKYDPCTPRRGYDSTRSLAVRQTEDGRVQVMTRLDLDDVWNLYFLLEDVIEPSDQIAVAMNAARYAEVRGPLEQRPNPDSHHYEVATDEPLEVLGTLTQDAPENDVAATIRDTLLLLALEEIDEEQALQRVMVVAGHTLDGRLVDPQGRLQSFAQLEHIPEEDGTRGDMSAYERAFVRQTLETLKITIGEDVANGDIAAALRLRAAELAGPLREALGNDAMNKARVRDQRSFEESGRSWEQIVREFLADSKAITERQDASAGSEQNENEQRNLAVRANMVLRDPEIGPTMDRTYRGTNYVSRSKNSPWVRLDMPERLKPFLSRNRPDMGKVMLALTQQRDGPAL